MKKKFKNLVKLFLALAIMFVNLAPSFIVFANDQLPSLEASYQLNGTGDYTVINETATIDHSVVTPITRYTFKLKGTNFDDVENYKVKIKYEFYGAWQNADSVKPDATQSDEIVSTGAALESGQTFMFDLSQSNMFNRKKNGTYKITWTVENGSAVEIATKSISVNIVGYKNGINITSINYDNPAETEVLKTDEVYDFDYTEGTVKVNVSLDLGDVNPNGFFTFVQSINGLQYLDKVVANYSELDSIIAFPLTYTNAIDGLYTYNFSFYSNDNKLVLSKDIKFKVKNSTLLAGATVDEYLCEPSNTLLDRLVVFSSLDENTKSTITDRELWEEDLAEYNLKMFDLALNVEPSYSVVFDSYRDVRNEDIAVMENIMAKVKSDNVILTVDGLINMLKLAYRYKTTNSAGWNANESFTPITDLIYFMDVDVLNREGEEALGTDILETGMKVNITIFGRKLSYNIIIKGNVVSEDGELKNADVLEAIDLAIGNSSLGSEYYLAADVNRDDLSDTTIGVDVSDISQLNYMIDNEVQTLNDSPITNADKALASIATSKNSLRVGEKFDVSFKLSGFNENANLADVIDGIQGKLKYDNSLVKLSSVSVNSNYGWDGNINLNSGNNFGKFLFAGNEASKLNSDNIIITWTFETLKVGTVKISAEELKAVYSGIDYDLSNDNDKSNEVSVDILRKLSTDNSIKSLKSSDGKFNKKFSSDVLEYTLYVSHLLNEIKLSGSLVSEYATTEAFKTYYLNDDVTYIKLPVTSETGVQKVYTIKVVKVDYRSNNNYLSALVVDGYEFDFNKIKENYEIKVKSDVNSLDVTAIAESEKAVVSISGNTDLKEGSNTIKVTVKAENEDVREYVINVIKEASAEPVSEENQTTKIVIIVLIIATLSGLSYLLFSDKGSSTPKNTFLDDEPVLSRKIENPKKEQVNNQYNNKNNKRKR